MTKEDDGMEPSDNKEKITPYLAQTDDYELFELHPQNRDIHPGNFERITKSMKKIGFSPHEAIGVVPGDNGKFVIIRGHHRFMAAMGLGIPIWYIFAEDYGLTLPEGEKYKKPWDLRDWLLTYVRIAAKTDNFAEEDAAYLQIYKYKEETGIPLGLTVSLLAGNSAGSTNKIEAFKDGRFRLGPQKHADDVKRIVMQLKYQKIVFAAQSYFVQALSKALMLDEFSTSQFMQKASSYKFLLEKQPNVDSYLDMIEKVYNWKSRNKVPIAFLAREQAKMRREHFGRPPEPIKTTPEESDEDMGPTDH
jgi:hypothetical protein